MTATYDHTHSLHFGYYFPAEIREAAIVIHATATQQIVLVVCH
jgi:hypothetical protein